MKLTAYDLEVIRLSNLSGIDTAKIYRMADDNLPGYREGFSEAALLAALKPIEDTIRSKPLIR